MISESFLILHGYKQIKYYSSGNSSGVCIYELGKTAYAVKKPKNEQMNKVWQISAQKSLELQKLLGELSTPVQTPKIISLQNDTLIESYQAGQPLDDTLYTSLPESEQNQIAYDMAYFLNELHQYQIEAIENTPPVHPEPLAYGTSAIIQNTVGENNWQFFQNNLRQINAAKNVGKRLGFTHQDLRPDNVLYDTETKKVKIIDFGESGNDKDLYYDFAPTISKPGLLPWALTRKIVENYNDLDKKVPVYIDINLVRDLQIQQILKLFEIKIFDTELELPRVSHRVLMSSSKLFSGYKNEIRIEKIPERTMHMASQFYNEEFKPLLTERMEEKSTRKEKARQVQNAVKIYKSYCYER